LKKGVLDAVGYETLIETTTQLNQVGADLGLNPLVHAITDVTGFGLAGHALEIAKASGVGIELTVSALPLLSQAESLARQEVVTGASRRNWLSYGERVTGTDAMPAWQRDVLTDPQTSGGLLLTCDESVADAVVDQIRSAGFASASRIGRVSNTVNAGTVRCI
jgi:selenide,water dikinase